MKQLWEEFCVEVSSNLPGYGEFKTVLCGLCANTGYIEHDAVSPAGTHIYLDRRPCICPNGRAIKKHLPKPPRVPRKKGLARYWVSWWEKSNDYRPLKSPPNKAILGWWCSGSREDASALVAWVEAKSLVEAKKAIAKDWPAKKREWRFADICKSGWTPTDRFPLSDWMKARAESKP